MLQCSHWGLATETHWVLRPQKTPAVGLFANNPGYVAESADRLKNEGGGGAKNERQMKISQ